MSSMTWYIRDSSQLLSSMQDQFVEGPLRVVLRGTILEVKIEGCPTTTGLRDRAELLAKSYVDHLGRSLGAQFALLTEEEFCSLPVWASQNLAMVDSAPHQRRGHVAQDSRRALRDARQSVTSYDYWPLKACYDYMQDGTVAEDRFFPEIYKMIETMANHFGGGWPSLRKKTGLAAEVDFLKEVANDPPYNERHPPKSQTPPQTPTQAERLKAGAFASRILRKFEELCRSEGLAG